MAHTAPGAGVPSTHCAIRTQLKTVSATALFIVKRTCYSSERAELLREKAPPSIRCFTAQKAAETGLGQARASSQELLPGLPMGAGAQSLGHSQLLSKAHQGGGTDGIRTCAHARCWHCRHSLTQHTAVPATTCVLLKSCNHCDRKQPAQHLPQTPRPGGLGPHSCLGAGKPRSARQHPSSTHDRGKPLLSCKSGNGVSEVALSHSKQGNSQL